MKTDGKVENIPYTLLYRRGGSRHITVRVKADGKVKVSAPPYGISKAAIERVIINNKEKLLNTIVKQQRAMHIYQNGEMFLYAGEHYTLLLEEGAHATITPRDSSLLVTYDPRKPLDSFVICHLIKELYREEARKRLSPLVAYWAEVLHVPIPPFSVRDSKTRWGGSCSAKGRLNFSLRCQALSEKQLSYLVLHEMAHLVHFNHSKEFHSLLFYYMSDYKQVQRAIFSLQRETQLCL